LAGVFFTAPSSSAAEGRPQARIVRAMFQICFGGNWERQD
jgi:hypothetical protein